MERRYFYKNVGGTSTEKLEERGGGSGENGSSARSFQRGRMRPPPRAERMNLEVEELPNAFAVLTETEHCGHRVVDSIIRDATAGQNHRYWISPVHDRTKSEDHNYFREGARFVEALVRENQVLRKHSDKKGNANHWGGTMGGRANVHTTSKNGSKVQK